MKWILRLLIRLCLLVLAFWLVTSAAVFVFPPISTLMWARYASLRPVERQFVPLEQMSSNLVRAVIMSEDGQYCRHNGVDWSALADVIDGDGVNRGASTLSMQVTKNMMLWPGRSYIRKALEVPMTLALDTLWGKRRMLETYLNIAEWGDGIFGAEAAARYAFGKSARALTPREAALLASALPNPFLRNPRHPTRHQLSIVAIIEARMNDADTWLDCLRKN